MGGKDSRIVSFSLSPRSNVPAEGTTGGLRWAGVVCLSLWGAEMQGDSHLASSPQTETTQSTNPIIEAHFSGPAEAARNCWENNMMSTDLWMCMHFVMTSICTSHQGKPIEGLVAQGTINTSSNCGTQ